MNEKTKSFFVLPVLLVILVGTVGLSTAFADMTSSMDKSMEKSMDKSMTSSMDKEKEKIGFAIGTKGWAVSNGEARPSIILLEGNAKETKNGKWSLDATGSVNYSTGTANVSLKGMANPETGKIKLTGKGMADSGVEFILILRGNYAPIYEQEDKYALNWSTAKIYVPETGIKIPLLQQGTIETIP